MFSCAAAIASPSERKRRGLIRRAQSADDGRTRPVMISRAGRRIADELVPNMHRFERELMAPLHRHELEALLDMVARLQQRVVDLLPGATPHIDG
jgi:DNA-binding MarR family transcriptional regulator